MEFNLGQTLKNNRQDYDYFPYTLNNSAFVSLT